MCVYLVCIYNVVVESYEILSCNYQDVPKLHLPILGILLLDTAKGFVGNYIGRLCPICCGTTAWHAYAQSQLQILHATELNAVSSVSEPYCQLHGHACVPSITLFIGIILCFGFYLCRISDFCCSFIIFFACIEDIPYTKFVRSTLSSHIPK